MTPLNSPTSAPISVSCRCQDCDRVETIGFSRGRDLRLPFGWDIWGDDVRCGACAEARRAQSGRKSPIPAGPSVRPEVLYIATDLESWTTEGPGVFARDVTVQGKVFRRLDPEYLAWLASRMERVRGACDEGKVAAELVIRLEERWALVRHRAIAILGEDSVRAIECGGEIPVGYSPPRNREDDGFELPAMTRCVESERPGTLAPSPGCPTRRRSARRTWAR